MTPTEQDKGLREQVADALRTGYHGIAETKVINRVMQLVTADSKRVALEARKDEVGRIVERVWGLDYGEETEKYLSVRIAELKAQQEEVK